MLVPCIKNLVQLIKPLYSKIRNVGQKYFNKEYIKLIQKKKKNFSSLHLSLEREYNIV